MQIFLDPAEKSAHAETPDTIFEPVRAIGIIVELLFSLGEYRVIYFNSRGLSRMLPLGLFGA